MREQNLKSNQDNSENQLENLHKEEDSIFTVAWFKSVFALDKAEMKNQMENYNTLNFWNSYRKLSALFVVMAIAVTIYFVDIISALPALFLVYFIYKGQRWHWY